MKNVRLSKAEWYLLYRPSVRNVNWKLIQDFARWQNCCLFCEVETIVALQKKFWLWECILGKFKITFLKDHSPFKEQGWHNTPCLLQYQCMEGVGAQENRGPEGHGRWEEKGGEAGFPKWRELGEKEKNFAILHNIFTIEIELRGRNPCGRGWKRE